MKGIIQGSEFNPKLAKHAQCAARLCFKSQFLVSNHTSVKRTRRVINQLMAFSCSRLSLLYLTLENPLSTLVLIDTNNIFLLGNEDLTLYL